MSPEPGAESLDSRLSIEWLSARTPGHAKERKEEPPPSRRLTAHRSSNCRVAARGGRVRLAHCSRSGASACPSTFLRPEISAQHLPCSVAAMPGLRALCGSRLESCPSRAASPDCSAGQRDRAQERRVGAGLRNCADLAKGQIVDPEMIGADRRAILKGNDQRLRREPTEVHRGGLARDQGNVAPRK